MPGPAGGGADGKSAFRPIGSERSRSRSAAGHVWLPLLPRLSAPVLAPTTASRRKQRQRWQPAIGGFTPPPPPIPPPPPPTPPINELGLLAPVVPVRWFPRQRWRPAIGQSQVQWSSIQRPLSSPRRLAAGRVSVPPVVRVPATATPLRGLSVSIRHRWKAGQARTPTALPPTPPATGTTLRVLRVSSPRRPVPGRVSFARNVPSAPAPPHISPILRPVSSPRRLTPGRVSVPHGPPPPTRLTPLRGLSVSIRHRWKPGNASTPPAFAMPAPPPPPGTGVLAPVSPIRRMRRQKWTAAIAGPTPPVAVTSVSRPVSSPRRLRAGRATVVRLVPPLVSVPIVGVSSVFRPVGSGWRQAVPRRFVWVPRYQSPVPAISRFAGSLLVGRRGDRDGRDRRGWLLHWLPIPLGGPLTIEAIAYHVYGNGGGGPIDYTTVLATVTGLSWTSGPLAYPDDWKFGVRAFDGYGEEQNLDAAVEIILDASGDDITNRPAAPTGLRAFALAGGTIRVEWAYPSVDRRTVPTGFHVYVVSPGTPNAGILAPVSPVRRMRRQRWLAGIGGSAGYQTPAKTVLFTSGIANTFVANLTGLADGTVYTIGVRAYNAVAEEPNTYTVTVTADATGPAAVDFLSGVAV